MEHRELVVVKTFGSRPEVDVAKSALASAGIDAIIEADTAGRMREHLAWSGIGFRLLVRADDAEAARDFLAAAGEASMNEDDEM
jgi:F420-dependent methylenetetrahydromethanopterin dehydrogenase